MASKVVPANLTVTISETITLNEKDEGSVRTFNIANINQVTHRIINIPTSQKSLCSFGAANGRGDYVFSDVQYVRVTNLDALNFVKLRFLGESTTDFAVRLDAGMSYLIGENDAVITGVDDYCDTGGLTLEKLTSINAIADTAAVNLEMFVACK
jgi:hypothetical protein